MSIIIHAEGPDSLDFEFVVTPRETDLQNLKGLRKIPYCGIVDFNRTVSNELRRILIADIPCWAIDDVEIEINTSTLLDEFLELRLNFAPLTQKILSLFTEDTIEYPISIEKKGPGILTNHDITIISEFEGEDNGDDDNARMISTLCPLRDHDEVCLKGWIRLGTMKQNAKWAAVSVVEYEEITANRYRFRFETTGRLPPRQILWQGVRILEERLGVVILGI